MKRILAAAVLGACVSFASAQSLKPGLWEAMHNTQFAGNSDTQAKMAQAQQQMANMPPEQRKMMEEMMKQRGISMNVRGGGTGMTVKYCLTPEMAARKEIPAQRGDCKTTHESMGPGKMKIAFTCSNPPSSGEGEVTFASGESYNMKMVVNTTVQGRPEKMNMESSARWLGADCGDIKPFASGR